MDQEAIWKAAFSIAISTIKSTSVTVYKKVFKKKPLSIEEIKRQTQVLFIDDESFDFLLENIRQSGWNVKQKKEIDNLDIEEIKNADIIFIDYKDVGTILTPSEEGIGLLKALRHKYPNKHLIFYSGYAGFIPGHEIHDIANGWISKNADPYVYIERIESTARKIYATS
jgi:hypothetical protein